MKKCGYAWAVVYMGPYEVDADRKTDAYLRTGDETLTKSHRGSGGVPEIEFLNMIGSDGWKVIAIEDKKVMKSGALKTRYLCRRRVEQRP